jgi:hypothetical protein
MKDARPFFLLVFLLLIKYTGNTSRKRQHSFDGSRVVVVIGFLLVFVAIVSCG